MQLCASVGVHGCGYGYDYGSEHLCLTHLEHLYMDMCMFICDHEWYYRCMGVVMAINMTMTMGVSMWIFVHGHVYVLALKQEYLKMK